MTKKDYIEIAKLLAAASGTDLFSHAICRDLATAFARLLAADNPRFDRDRFFAACKVTP